MRKEFLTIDDLNFKGKTVLCRIDMNSPVDIDSGEFLTTIRSEAHAETIKALQEKGARVVLLSHQGRPGDYDFLSLEKQTGFLRKAGVDVDFVDDIFFQHARDTIKKMKDGQAILLENVRFYSEEILNRPPDVQARTFLVKKLAPLADYFVLDCFSVAHRSQPSIVGFTQVLPSCAGRVMEKEVNVLTKALESSEKPKIYVLGGAKADTSIKVAEYALKKGADKILTGGLIANIFLMAMGYRLGEKSEEQLKGADFLHLIKKAKDLLAEFDGKIQVPSDVALDTRAGREEILVSELPRPYGISDIGKETVGRYIEILKSTKTVIFNGPMGVFEKDDYKYGTKRLLKVISELDAFKICGGGHTSGAVVEFGVADKFDHVSTGGNACMLFLAGQALPGIVSLKQSKEKKDQGTYKKKA